jgi:pyruvate/2-oxoglutarate dehydrogenase complex dihydrolipoamide acyltransferase (E2) component
MRHEVVLPDLGEGVAEATIVRWLVAAGDVVVRDQPLVEVETDKATVDIPAAVAGVVDALQFPAGAVVPVGATLTAIRDARAGRDGARARPLPDAPRAVPAVTVVEECDFTGVLGLDGGPSPLPWVVMHAARALAHHPDLNATYRAGRAQRAAARDVGIAVHTPRGLVMPVLRSADELSIDQVAAAIERLAAAARDGTLDPAATLGATFTITSPGRLGGLFATPLVPAPQVAILGLHRIALRPAVVDGEVVARRIGMVSCSFDHRAVAGVAAAAFLVDVVDRLATSPRAPSGSAIR